MISQSSVWKVEPDLCVNFGGNNVQRVVLQEIFVISDSLDCTLDLVEKVLGSGEEYQAKKINALSNEVYLPDDLKEPDREESFILLSSIGSPVKLYKLTVKIVDEEKPIEIFAVADNAKVASGLVSQSFSDGALVTGIEILSQRVYQDNLSYSAQKREPLETSSNQGLWMRSLSKEEQNHPILQDKEPWFRILKSHGGTQWGSRYANVLSDLGINTVSDLALNIMVLKLEALKPQRFGIPFRFVNKTPDGKSLEIKSAFGGYGWFGVLRTLQTRGFQWRDYVINKDKLDFYQENQDPKDRI